jgi:hypothetical protein
VLHGRPEPRVAVLQRDLIRKYAVHDPRCEQNVRAHDPGRFVCLFNSEGIPLTLDVTQATRDSTPVVTGCEGARRLHRSAFVTCSIGAGEPR